MIARPLEEGFSSENIGTEDEDDEEEEEDGSLISKRGISGKVWQNASVAA